MLRRQGSWVCLEMRLPETAYAPCGFDAGDANLRRVVGNSPTNAIDPSGLQDKKLGLQLIDYGLKIAEKPEDDVPGARETSRDRLKKTLTDSKFAYSFTFEFVISKEYANDRNRYLLQALRNNLLLVAPDGSVSRPMGATKENNYSVFKVDQKALSDIAVRPGASPTAQDYRVTGPLGADGGIVIGPNAEKLTPAVFGIEVVESLAGISNIKYEPIKGDGGRLSNLPVTEADYKRVRDAISAQKTETVTYYVFYNPGNYKGEGDPGKFVLDALGKSDPATQKQVEDVLKNMKLTLGKKSFESYSFPNFSDINPLTVEK